MIRLSALQTFGNGIRQFLQWNVPLCLVARMLYSSSESVDYLQAWLGCCFLQWIVYMTYDTNEKSTIANTNMTTTTYSSDTSKSTPARTRVAMTNSRTKNGTSKKKHTLHRHNTPSSTAPLLANDLPTAMVAEICTFLHPKDVCTLSCLNRASRQYYDTSTDVWKALWYRDYGNVLLKWSIGREVLEDSLSNMVSLSRAAPLEWRLANALDKLYPGGIQAQQNDKKIATKRTDQNAIPFTMKDFYFVFGEIYISYLLARRNDVNRAQGCLLGLYGHVFDFGAFARYHPGLIDDIVQAAGGQDATDYFEDLPHSSGARAIAQRLVLLIHRGTLPSGPGCGLYLLPQIAKTAQRRMLEASNTRPPSFSANDKKMSILPKKPASASSSTEQVVQTNRRHAPTLCRIRKEWKEDLQYQKERTRAGFFASSSNWRIYYDPFQQEWKQWNVAEIVS